MQLNIKGNQLKLRRDFLYKMATKDFIYKMATKDFLYKMATKDFWRKLASLFTASRKADLLPVSTAKSGTGLQVKSHVCYSESENKVCQTVKSFCMTPCRLTDILVNCYRVHHKIDGFLQPKKYSMK